MPKPNDKRIKKRKMKRIHKKSIIVSLLFIVIICSLSSFVFSENPDSNIKLHIFYGKGCPHCGTALDFLDSIKQEYPQLSIEKHEIYFNQEERNLFEKITNAFGEEIEGVPTIFIDNKVIVGFSNSIKEQLEQQIQECALENCEDPINKVRTNETTKIIGDSSPSKNPHTSSTIKKLTIPAVLSAALVDAINPCAFAVLIILMSTVLISKNRKKALFAGLAFSLSIFISYFLMGIGLYSAIQATGLSHTFYLVVAILAIIIGLFNLKDYLWYGKWFKMEVPDSWRPKMKCLIQGVTSVPGAFLVGFLVSLFLLPCTSGPYIVILGLLAQATTKTYAIFLLIIYNLIFILPMIIINLAIFFGLTTTEQAEKLRTRKLKVLHLIAGIIILCLGIGMLIAIKLGMI